jgi:uncharacterized protein
MCTGHTNAGRAYVALSLSNVPMAIKIVACPRCGTPVEWVPESRFRPFCSERCKTGDLGAWAAGEYRIPGEVADDLNESGSEREKD